MLFHIDLQCSYWQCYRSPHFTDSEKFNNHPNANIGFESWSSDN